MKRHLKSHSGEKPFKCDNTLASFKHSSSVKRHLRTHGGEKLFKCDLCEVQFSQSEKLKAHLSIYSEEKQFKCDLYQANFYRSDVLKAHKRIHSGEKNSSMSGQFQWVCAFEDSAFFKRHLRTMRNTPWRKTLKCDLSPANFSCCGSEEAHQRTHSGNIVKCKAHHCALYVG